MLRAGVIGICDQLVYAAMSLIGLAWAARVLDEGDVGILATYFVTVTLIAGAFRTGFGEPLSLLPDVPRARDALSRSVSAAAPWLIVAVVVVALGLSITARHLGLWTLVFLVIVSASVPLHELLRASAFAAKRPLLALSADSAALAALLTGFVIGERRGAGIAFTFVVVFWFGPFVLSAVAALLLAGRIRLDRSARTEARPYVTEYALGAGAGNFWFLFAGLLVGGIAVATLRLVQAVFGVFSSIQLGLRAALVRHLADSSTSKQERHSRTIGISLAAVTAVGSIVLHLMPADLWVSALGEYGTRVQGTVLWFGAFRAVEFLVFGEFLRFRSAGRLSGWNRIRVYGVSATAITIVPLGLTAGSTGIVFAMTIGSVVSFFVALAASRRSQLGSTPPPASRA